MAGVRYMDDRHYEYRVLPMVWIWGFRSFRRYHRRRWKVVGQLPLRHTETEAEEDLARYAEGKGWVRI